MLILSSEITLHLNQGHAFNENKQTIQSLFFCKILSLKNFLSMKKQSEKSDTLLLSFAVTVFYILY